MILAFFIIACFVGVFFSLSKYQANAYDFDHSYFLQLSAKLFDAKSSHAITTVPIGANMFGLGSFEGVKGFHKTLHLELMKYFQGLAYYIFQAPWAVYAFVALVYFSPLLYLLFLFKDKDPIDKSLAVVVAFLYAFYPAAIFAVSFDLRPFVYLIPYLLLFFLSVHFRRPAVEIFFFLNLFFCAREEAFIFSFLIIAYYFLINRGQLKGTAKIGIGLAANWLAWIGIIAAFNIWAGYSFTDKSLYRFAAIKSVLLSHWLLAFIFGLFLVLLFCLFYIKIYKKDQEAYLDKFGSILVLGALSAPAFLGAWKKAPDPKSWIQLFYFPRYALLIPAILISGLFIFYARLRGDGSREKFIRYICLFSLLAFSFNFLPLADSPLSVYDNFSDQKNKASFLWDLRQATDKYHTAVLVTDYAHGPFYDYENLFFFPCSSPSDFNLERIDEPVRCYPGNEKHLIDLLQNRIEYVIIDNDFSDLTTALFKEAGVKIIEKKSNGRYSWFKLNKNKSI